MYWVQDVLGAVVVIFHMLFVFLRGCHAEVLEASLHHYCHAEALEASHQSYILLFTLYSYCSFFGIAMGEGAAGVFAGFPAKGNPPD